VEVEVVSHSPTVAEIQPVETETTVWKVSEALECLPAADSLRPEN
jgi:hypothetical protein